MNITFQCPKCGNKFVMDESMAGKQVKCWKCENTFAAPAAGAPAPMAPQGAPMDMGAAASAKKPCPYCGETIEATAKKCKFCNEWLDPAMRQQQQAMVNPTDADMTTGDWIVAIICSLIGCIAGIVWMCQGKPKGKKMFLVSLVAGAVWTVIRFAAAGASGGFR